MLGGASADPASPLPVPPTLMHAVLPALGAIALAAATLARHKLSASLRRAGAFLTVGATTLAMTLLLLYR
ncbi:MAG TPA: hypothetical protein VF334_22060 [Polyangia bacterium]